MAVQTSYPGVYIEEFAPAPPIQGVGTSTAAFIGPAARGELNTPTKLTSFDAFKSIFGDRPLNGFFLWYAVRGFFENGGQVCYIVRASRGRYAGLGFGAANPLQNRAQPTPHDTLRVRAREPGTAGNQLQVQTEDVNLLTTANTALYAPAGAYTVIALRQVDLTNEAEAAQFRPGDLVDLGGTDRSVLVVGATGRSLRLGSDLNAAVNATGNIRLADAPVGTQTIRIASTVPVPAGTLVPGTMLTISQGTGATAFTDTQLVDAVQPEPLQTNPAITTYRVTLRQGLGKAFSLDPSNAATVQSEEFNFLVIQGAATRRHDNLSVDAAHPRYYVRVINDSGGAVIVEPIEPPPPDPPPQSIPQQNTAVSLAGGADENLGALTAADYIQALETLVKVDDVNLVAIPDAARLPDWAAVQQAIIGHCELTQDRFGVLDSVPNRPPFGAGSVRGVDNQRTSVTSTRGYAALYYPWLRVLPAGGGEPILVPPSGHVCGIIARVDLSRGVFKAPANELVNGAVDIQPNGNMSDVDQGQLNLAGINVIRVFQGGGRPILWGARTTASDLNWQYVNIRRLFLFLEESIQEGIRYAVFEPNNLALWAKLKRTISAFLLQQWVDGALFGATPEDAFYVRIDEALNPFNEQALGRLTIEIGVRPTFPAEFIIVRIGISATGEAEVVEA
jgi:phage tail sheath protein FI